MALTKFNFNSFDVTSAASKGLGFNASANGFSTINPGSMTLIKTLTASSSANLSFVHGSSDVVLDNTYPVYVFKFINIHASTDNAEFGFKMSVDTGSNYNVAKTTTAFRSYHPEDNSSTAFNYVGTFDLAQGTGLQPLSINQGIANDNCAVGTLHLFNPSSTTFVKHFIANTLNNHSENVAPAPVDNYFAGYGNTTSAVDAIQFAYSSGTIDAGTIKMYGIKDS